MFHLFYKDLGNLEEKQIREVLALQQQVESLLRSIYIDLEKLVSKKVPPDQHEAFEKDFKLRLKNLYAILKAETREIKQVTREERKGEKKPNVYGDFIIKNAKYTLNNDSVFEDCAISDTEIYSDKPITITLECPLVRTTIHAPKAKIICTAVIKGSNIMCKELDVEGIAVDSEFSAHKFKRNTHVMKRVQFHQI